MATKNLYPAWAEIDLKALAGNFKSVKKLAQKQFKRPSGAAGPFKCPQILAVIKADAYGHGLVKVAERLQKEGVDFFGVSNTAEAVRLRESKITKPVLLFETTLPAGVKDIIRHRLTPSVCTIEFARALNRAAKAARRKTDVHVKVDTGMGRLGVPLREAENFLDQLQGFSHLRVTGIYTHFPVADTDPQFTYQQITDLEHLLQRMDRKAKIIAYGHAANSAGLVAYPSSLLNLVRAGITLYGLHPHESLREKISLKPVMTVKARIVFLKDVEKGDGLSYGRTFIAPHKMKVATLAIGYGDGYFRAFSNKASVIVNGRRCPVVGRVTMDQMMVDVSKVDSIKIGDAAVILGKEKDAEVSADDLAGWADTINYEVICSLGNRLPRIYKD